MTPGAGPGAAEGAKVADRVQGVEVADTKEDLAEDLGRRLVELRASGQEVFGEVVSLFDVATLITLTIALQGLNQAGREIEAIGRELDGAAQQLGGAWTVPVGDQRA